MAVKNSLPLDWTEVQRCGSGCDNPATCGGRHLQRPFSTTASDHDAVLLEGRAIFCLCEIDPSWFQGYFVCGDNGDGSKPIGLLAEQTDIDDCLACADGGYHEISMKLHHGKGRTETLFTNVAWTGGDMMKLEGDKVVFETERFLSGQDAVPLVRQFFGGLVNKLRNGEDDRASILEIIPDVAVIVGKMRLVLPNE